MANMFNPVAAQAPAAATAAVATLTAPMDGKRWRVRQIRWSYTAAPTGGSLVIAWTDGSALTETYAITASGPGSITFSEPRRFPPNTLVTITLASGAGAVVGTVYVDADTGN